MFPIRATNPIETRKSYHASILCVTFRCDKQDKYHKKTEGSNCYDDSCYDNLGCYIAEGRT